MPLLAAAIYSNLGLYLRTLTLAYESMSWMVIETNTLKNKGNLSMENGKKSKIKVLAQGL